MEQLKYDVFISYSSKDYIDEEKNVIPNNVISQIKAALREAGISYWFDEEGIYSGDEFAPVLARAIKDSELFLFISSANSNESEWTSSEIATAHAYGKKIIPFKIDGSVFHESVIMYVARLNSIDYYLNPPKAVGRLVESIQDYMTVKREERERFMKEQKEQEELRRRKYEKEQKELANSIELGAKDLDVDEAKVDIMRRRLQANVEKVDNPETRDRLSALIEESGPIYRRQKEERRRLGETIDLLKDEKGSLQTTIDSLKEETEHKARSRVAQTKERVYEFLRDYKLWCAGVVIFGLCVLAIVLGGLRNHLSGELEEVKTLKEELSVCWGDRFKIIDSISRSQCGVCIYGVKCVEDYDHLIIKFDCFTLSPKTFEFELFGTSDGLPLSKRTVLFHHIASICNRSGELHVKKENITQDYDEVNYHLVVTCENDLVYVANLRKAGEDFVLVEMPLEKFYPYACELCEDRYERPQDLDIHLITHPACNVCQRRFKDGDALGIHRRKEHKYVCHLCEDAIYFETERELRNHQRRYHYSER